LKTLKKIIRKLAREEFIAYRGERYVMPGTIVVVAGKFSERAVVRQVREFLVPLHQSVAAGTPIKSHWQAGGPWTPVTKSNT